MRPLCLLRASSSRPPKSTFEFLIINSTTMADTDIRARSRSPPPISNGSPAKVDGVRATSRSPVRSPKRNHSRSRSPRRRSRSPKRKSRSPRRRSRSPRRRSRSPRRRSRRSRSPRRSPSRSVCISFYKFIHDYFFIVSLV